MISYDLRGELESAYDVHPFAAKCRQAVLKSLLLWATMSHAQRPVIAWNNERNLQLGQALIQHLLDFTAEVNGVNSDEIYAALQAEQNPFLKKLHVAMHIGKSGDRERKWGGRYEGSVGAIESRRSTTTIVVSPTLCRELSKQESRIATTVLAESFTREEPPPTVLASTVPTPVAVPTKAAQPECTTFAQAQKRAVPPTPVSEEKNGEGAPPPYYTASTKTTTAPPHYAGAAAITASAAAVQPPSSSFAAAAKGGNKAVRSAKPPGPLQSAKKRKCAEAPLQLLSYVPHDPCLPRRASSRRIRRQRRLLSRSRWLPTVFTPPPHPPRVRRSRWGNALTPQRGLAPCHHVQMQRPPQRWR
jgi:hypothetical protein